MTSPPRLALKLALTLIRVVEENHGDPASQLVVIRGWRTATLVLKKGALTAAQLDEVKRFSRERSFDVAYLEGLAREETNRFNRLAGPVIYDAVHAMLGAERAAFVERYKFDLAPAVDNRPFAYHFFRWQTFAELLGRAKAGGAAQMEWGYIVLLATLLQALLLSLALIIVPVWVRGRVSVPMRGVGTLTYTLGVVGYFGAVGLAFLFVEIAYVHSLQRILHHPVFAVSAVLAAFLVFAGLGSSVASRLRPLIGRLGLWPVAGGIVVAALVPFLAVPAMAQVAAGWPLAVRIAVAVAMLAPLAFLMGMPFPTGLRTVASAQPERLPLAWAANGCASVVGAVGAQITALGWGFSGTLGVGLVMYVAAAATLGPLLKADQEGKC